MKRREILKSAAAGAGLLVAGGSGWVTVASAATGRFQHGVASGDPLPGAVVIWTRVTPVPEATPGSGLGPTVQVTWEVARDPAFTRVVRRGTAAAVAATDHTVKIDVTGLAPATEYYYRFASGGARSRVGRTRTAPAPTAVPPAVRLGVVSCSNWEAGFFSSYRHLANRADLDFILHLGDYLYEYPRGEYGDAQALGRLHQPTVEIVTLAHYRQRHGQYKTDPDLQRLHARYPFVTVWDDHELANDAWRAGAENHQPASEGRYALRQRSAYQANLEWQPVRPPVVIGTRIYRRLRFGTLADLSLLDLRQYRDEQVGRNLAAVDDPARTITGDAQMNWFKTGLANSPTTWHLVGNSVMITPVVFPPLPDFQLQAVNDVTGLYPDSGVPYNVDQWDGYTADRAEVLDHLVANRIDNTVFLTGDIHSAWACDVPRDPGTYPVSPSVATELVCTSVTSDNLNEITRTSPARSSIPVETAIKANNRHVKLLDFDNHGYSVVEVTPSALTMDYHALSDRRDRNATQTRAYRFRVPAGSNRVQGQ